MQVGLIGGVGSGKSTVRALFAEHGAVVIDADQIAREVVEPGTPGLASVLERFSTAVQAADGSLDRAALAAIVFADPAALADLNAIVHPLVRARSTELLAAVPEEAIAVYEVPIMAEGGPVQPRDFDLVIAVESALPIRLARLEERGLPREQANARVAAQASDEQRRAIAHLVITNDGSREELAAEVDDVWSQLVDRAAADA
jgi:dephospho-CoA kinase